ncbi:MAG: ribonuclease HII [Rhodospirillaceae bacterium]|nr:ribonuclease HII [Rhodospirillaceae bacterium]
MGRDRTLPTLATERDIDGMVAGVDEAGCAPLAGPVVAAAVVLPGEWRRRPAKLKGLTDSKQLSAAERARFHDLIRAAARVGVGAASAAEIDRINIRRAALTAMQRAVADLGCADDLAIALVDGNQPPALPCPVQTVVKGDSSVLSIAAASVIAKVTRDRLMARLARRYPGYGWLTNQGYGTEEHYLGLLRLGPTRHHRRTFAPLSTLFGGGAMEPALPGLDEAVGAGNLSLRLVVLRNDLHAVFDGEDRHVGVLKCFRRQWTFRACGAAEDGAMVVGAGRFAAWHNLPVAEPRAEALLRVLARPVEAAAAG